MDCSESDEAHEVGEEFVISGGDAAELLEFIEEAFDAVSFLVDGAIISVLMSALRHGRNDRGRVVVEDGVVQAVGVIGAIGEDIAGLETVDQCFSLADVAILPRRTDQAQGITQSLDSGVDFGGQAAFGPTQALGIRPPFSSLAPAAWLCARMTVLSIESHSRSAS